MTTKNNDEKLTFKELVAAYKNEAKESYNTFRDKLKRPLTRAVYGQRISGVAGSILRAFIIFGLSFIILYPIFQEVIVAIKDPVDLNNPLVIWIPEHFSLVNIQISAELLDYWNALKKRCRSRKTINEHFRLRTYNLRKNKTKIYRWRKSSLRPRLFIISPTF